MRKEAVHFPSDIKDNTKAPRKCVKTHKNQFSNKSMT